jgi:hypothetical protein
VLEYDTVQDVVAAAMLHVRSGDSGELASGFSGSPGPATSKSISTGCPASAGTLSVAVTVCVAPVGLSAVSGVSWSVLPAGWLATATPASGMTTAKIVASAVISTSDGLVTRLGVIVPAPIQSSSRTTVMTLKPRLRLAQRDSPSILSNCPSIEKVAGVGVLPAERCARKRDGTGLTRMHSVLAVPAITSLWKKEPAPSRGPAPALLATG